jgi:hypothetical protein
VTTDALAEAIEHYLRTGKHDPRGAPWPGNIIERSRRAHHELMQALVREVMRRAKTRPAPDLAQAFDSVAFTRAKVEPMVSGLFPRGERQAVLALLERAGVFLTLPTSNWCCSASAGSVRPGTSRPCTWGASGRSRWARMPPPSLGSVRRRPASSPCSISRRAIPSPTSSSTRWRTSSTTASATPWGFRSRASGSGLLDIDYRRRETFAYACEAYARIVGRARGLAGRAALAREYGCDGCISEARVDPARVADILYEAALRRNGWKVILARCAPATLSAARARRAEVMKA